jgi:predicted regulator of Ras-like GTPase activity (Roadblock/LC7/MglB family)
LAVIVGAIVVWDLRKGTTTEDALAKGKRLVDFKADDVTKLTISRSNEVVVVEKSGEKWQLKQPLVYRAGGLTVSSILGDVELAESDRVLSEKETKATGLAAFGLDQPRIRAALETKKGPVTLLVGRETPTKEAVYIQVEGRPTVAIVRKNLAERLATKVADLRDHEVFEVPSTTVTRLEVRSGDRLLELAKTAPATNVAPRWAIVKPSALRADQQKVDDLVRDLTGLRVQDFVSDDPKEVHSFQLDEPVREVTVFVGEKGQTLQLGRAPTNATGKVFAKLKGSDAVFTIYADTAKKFGVQPNDLRDAQILSFNEADVKTLDVQRGGLKLQVVRQSNDVWQITTPVNVAADADRVKELLTKLGGLTATQFVADVAADLGQYGLATPAATVTLRGAATNTVAELLVGGMDAGKAMGHVKRSDEPFVYGVEAKNMEWLPSSALGLRDRNVAAVKTGEVTKVTIETKEGKSVVGKGQDGKWVLVEPAQGGLDLDGLKQLLESVSQIRAEEFLEEKVEQPETKVTFEVAGRSYVLQVGRKLPTGYKVVSWGDPALVFTMPEWSLTAFLRPVVLTPPAPATTNAPAVP